MKLIIALLLISTSALCQKIDTLKVKSDEEIKKIQYITDQISILEALKSTMIESAFHYNGIPVPEKVEYKNGVILYIKNEEKKTATGK